ncbi:XRE family transcriptional regulator [Macrococcus carouselicus]|uniref:XRE family transcriptional regulator n=2 Tax=Macrococcus carouselicus TaxID=69969 RepID=A0A9Q8CKP4_9STAP|nr:XRE family transcriptional regulator [Macrococcus carouselicus]
MSNQFNRHIKRREIMILALSKQMKKNRLDHQYTVRDLSNKTGISFAYINQLENNKRGSVTLDTFFRLSEAFDMMPSQLLKNIEDDIRLLDENFFSNCSSNEKDQP